MAKQIKKTEEIKKQQVTEYFPFRVVEKDEKAIITLGNAQIVGKEFKTTKDAIKYIKSKPYELIINAACYCMELHTKGEQK